jgi:hypothetical protein
MSQSKEALILRLRDWAKAVFARMRAYRINEISSVHTEFDREFTSTRLNVVFTALSQESLFGGTATAIRFLHALLPYFTHVRLIVLNEADDSFEAEAWSGWTLDSARDGSARTIAFLAGDDAVLRVAKGDRFIATHWTTAYSAKRYIAAAQVECAEFPTQFVYLIQDFEPAFYPWSSQYLLADSTYAGGKDIVAVFNTKLLADYFRLQGYSFRDEYHFEPRLNERLAQQRNQVDVSRKENLILIYGRPATHRNAFELIVEALHEWSRIFPSATKWSIVSLGEKHRQLRLGAGPEIQSLGKVTLEEYAAWLKRASIGISLMVSPHPSYPPLEMADFGLRVITNSFANKDLATRSPNILSLREASPATIAVALSGLCSDHEKGFRVEAQPTSAFLGAVEEFPFAEALALTMGGTKK